MNTNTRDITNYLTLIYSFDIECFVVFDLNKTARVIRFVLLILNMYIYIYICDIYV